LTRARRAWARFCEAILAADRHPEWPLRCTNRGCRDAAYTAAWRPAGARWLCDDCARHAETTLTPRSQESPR
jgi:hypothetical protein